jgi:sugar phosphate isomerase/epimerase
MTLSRRHFISGMAAAGGALPFVSAENALHLDSAAVDAVSRREICVFSKHLQFLDYEATADVAAEIGFDGIDFTVRPGGHVLPENVERDLPKAVRAAQNAGLATPMMTTAISAADEPMAETTLRTAAALGIRSYRMNWVSYGEGILESLQAYRQKFRRLAELNEELGLHGAYQNHSGTQIGAPVWDLHLLLEDLDPRFAGCQYDIRHATVEGGSSWPLGLRLIHSFVRTTVIKDFVWEKREGSWQVKNVPLAEGMVDFPSYFALIKKLEIAGPISLHFEYELPQEVGRLAETSHLMRRDLQTLRTFLSDAELE